MLFRQERIGKGGEPFTLLKFRTMEDGLVTRPFLRKSGLDELPQFINILRGDMALFGPRPEVPHIDAKCAATIPLWHRRYEVKPGLLSLASITGGIRGKDRFTHGTKAEQAELDVQLIDGGVRIKAQILWALPRALRKGQTA